MWRLIVVTFGFLGWAFYVLSGGADYVPHSQSIQARAKTDDTLPAEPSSDIAVAAIEATEPTTKEAQVTRAASSIADMATQSADRVEVTLVSIRPGAAEASRDTTDKVRVLTAPEPGAVDAAVAEALSEAEEEVARDWPGAIELFAMQADMQAERKAAIEAERAAMDIRYVTGNVVNMRGGPGTEFDKIASLNGGTEVAVIAEPGNGWVMLRVMDTGEEGWMADWLVSAAAN